MKAPKLDARRVIYATLVWSKAAVPLIALLAAIASSIRTIQTTAEIYAKSGSTPVAVVIAAGAFTMSVEGALFLLALAQENQQIKWRQARKKRHVTTLRSIGRGIGVRFGTAEPLSYDQLPESDGGLNTLIIIAFLFAIASNLYLGLKPLTEQMGAVSLQAFIGRILNAEASLQLTFIVDMAGVLFPPFMALKAGHLTARFAAEVSASQNRKVSVQSERPSERIEKRVERSADTPKLSASERVIQWLTEHPEDERLSQNALAKRIGVSVGTVNAVFKTRSVEQPIEHSSNGHRKD